MDLRDLAPTDAYDGVVDTATVVKSRIDVALATQAGRSAPSVEVTASNRWLESMPPKSSAEVTVSGPTAAVASAIEAIQQLTFDI